MRFIFIFLFLGVSCFGQDLSINAKGGVYFERVFEVGNTRIERAVSWALENKGRVLFFDKDYGKLIFEGKFETFALDGKKTKQQYSGDVHFVCTVWIKAGKCKVLFSNFLHEAEKLNLGSCGEFENKDCLWGDDEATNLIWRRIKIQTKTKLVELMEQCEGYLLTDEFDF